MTRITVNLTKQEREALIALAGKELRHPRSQAAFIIRMELQRQGLIDIKSPSITAAEVLPGQLEKEVDASLADRKQE